MTLMKWLVFVGIILFSTVPLHATEKALIVFEGKDLPTSPAKGDGLQLYQLLGHFDIEKEIIGSEEYKLGEVHKYPYVFFIGFTKNCKPSPAFLHDAYQYKGTLIWLNTGILAYHATYPLNTKYSFEPLYFDTVSGFNFIIDLDKHKKFTKSDPNLNVLKILDKGRVQILAEAQSPSNKTAPYAIRSGNFYFFADSPFAYATGTDRYLFFAEKLHDILNQPHHESHQALIRIEDVHPLEDPEKIRKIADLLSSEGVPFLVSVIPFYVDPGRNIRTGLSDKPDMVHALRYAQSHGGSILMHGVTHQYRGITTIDFEFWDESNNRPIKSDNAATIEKKIESGVIELMKNGIFPIAWETPHYTASNIDYEQIGKIFSTAVEVRLAINHFDYGQFFPYVIHKDIYGQKILPENLGYVPLGEPEEMEKAVQEIIEAARAHLFVRDSYATAFFHPFLPLNLLKSITTEVKKLGYQYVDIKNETHFVKFKDRVILTRGGSISLQIEDQYLKEVYIDKKGRIVKTEISDQRIRGNIARNISLESGWIYTAEPIEHRDPQWSALEKFSLRFKKILTKYFPPKKFVTPAFAAILWNPSAQDGAMLDQLSFFTALRSVGIPVDRLTIDHFNDLSKYNLLIVPYSSAGILPDAIIEKLKNFIREGGFGVTDSKNPLAMSLDVKFGHSVIQLAKVQDELFPTELLSWEIIEPVYRIEVERGDEIVCTEDRNKIPVGIVRKYGKGKFIVISARFDPISGAGYARFPYLVEWLKTYFQLYPVLRRDLVEVYFDPGLRKKLNIESLVKQWAEFGIRAVHVAGWHEYPKFQYDYDNLIRLCHVYGLLVYAWIEPPQISKKFYDENPQWRENNYKGEDVQYDWRYPVALTDPSCLSAATEWIQKFLSSHDWDGVNIAEIYFGGGGAPNDPKLLTPFHQSVRKQFKEKFGFDPIELFQPHSPHYYKVSPQDWKKFVNFRVNLITTITSHFISVASEAFQSKPGAQIILTILDQKTVPELRTKIGVDVDQILHLKKKFDFALQVEDPAAYWNKDPRRYVEIGRKYKELLGGDSADLLIDLNILNFRNETYRGIFPTLTPTGIEAYLLIQSAIHHAPRATIYSEATVYPQDLTNFPYVLASTAHLEKTTEGYKVKADYPVILHLDDKVRQISLNGRSMYPLRRGSFLLPPGEHIVKIKEIATNPFENHYLRSNIVSASCLISSLHTSQRGVEFTYDSRTRCAVSFNKMPSSVFVDDKEIHFDVAREEQNYGILLPPGTHKVLIVLGSKVSYGIDLTSFWSSTLTVLFGILASNVLVVLIILMKVYKRKLFRA